AEEGRRRAGAGVEVERERDRGRTLRDIVVQVPEDWPVARVELGGQREQEGEPLEAVEVETAPDAGEREIRPSLADRRVERAAGTGRFGRRRRLRRARRRRRRPADRPRHASAPLPAGA